MEKNQIYKCEVCGNIIELIEVGGGELICCGKQMVLMQEKTADVGKEKHIPVVEKTENIVKIKVGEIPHPMTKEHYIQFIEVLNDKEVLRKDLNPEERPEAELTTNEVKKARAYCNIHGLWRSK